jgi:hypothetical protein
LVFGSSEVAMTSRTMARESITEGERDKSILEPEIRK